MQLEGHVGLFCCVVLRYRPLLHRRDLGHFPLRRIHVQGVGHGPVVLRFFHVRGGVGTAGLVIGGFNDVFVNYSINTFLLHRVTVFPGLQLPNAVVVVDRSFAAVDRNGQAGEGVVPPLAADLRLLCIAAVQVDYGYIIPIRTIGGPLEDKPGGPGHGSVRTRAGVVLVAPVIPDLLHRHLHGIQRVGADAGVALLLEHSIVDQAGVWVFVVIALPINGLYVPIVGYRRLNDPVFQEDVTAVAALVGHHRWQAGEVILRCILPCIIIDPCLYSYFVLIMIAHRLSDILIFAGVLPGFYSAVVHCYLEPEGYGQVEAQVVLGNGLVVLVHPMLLKPDRGLDAVGEGAEIGSSRIVTDFLSPHTVTGGWGVDLVFIRVRVILCGSSQLQFSAIELLGQRVGPGHTVGGVHLKRPVSHRMDGYVPGVDVPIRRFPLYLKLNFFLHRIILFILGGGGPGQGEKFLIIFLRGPESELVPIVPPHLDGGEICVSIRFIRLFVQEGGLDILGLVSGFGGQICDEFYTFRTLSCFQLLCFYCILCRPGVVPHQLVFDLRDGVLIFRAVGGVEVQILVKHQFQGNQAG